MRKLEGEGTNDLKMMLKMYLKEIGWMFKLYKSWVIGLVSWETVSFFWRRVNIWILCHG